VKQRLVRIAKFLIYPAFYVVCLAFFGYLKFPFNRLKDRVVAEFDKRGKAGQRLEIGKLGSYWLTGVEVSNVKLHLPPDDGPAAGMPGAADFGASATPAKETVLSIDEAHVRVRILPLLIGRMRVDFWASAFGGEISGTAPVGGAKGAVELALDHVDLARVEPLGQALGVPFKGSATGKLALDAPDGKFNKANGSFDLTIADVIVSDGKTKIAGLLELPPAKLGDLVMSAEAKDGTLKITKLAAAGTDLEIVGEGKITLREPWSEAVADLHVRFRFTDAYRGKSSATKALLGEPGSASHGLMEGSVPKMAKARRPDGFYGWHVYGPLKKLRFEPNAADVMVGAAVPAPTAPHRPPVRSMDGPAGRRPGTLPALAAPPATPATPTPEGTAQQAAPAPPPPPPPPPPAEAAPPPPAEAPEAPRPEALRLRPALPILPAAPPEVPATPPPEPPLP
jgi:type II secretion system protein N